MIKITGPLYIQLTDVMRQFSVEMGLRCINLDDFKIPTLSFSFSQTMQGKNSQKHNELSGWDTIHRVHSVWSQMTLKNFNFLSLSLSWTSTRKLIPQMKQIVRPGDRDNVLGSQCMILDYFKIIYLNKSNFEDEDKLKKKIFRYVEQGIFNCCVKI